MRIEATPRLTSKARRGKPPSVVLEHDLEVVSRRESWFSSVAERTTHVRAHGALASVEENGYRLVFSVEGHLFALDLELHRAL